MEAIVEWSGKKDISGFVKFSQSERNEPVQVSIKISGLENGFHGFHIHEKPIEDFDLSVEDCCEKLGGHFNVGEKWSLENQSGTKHGINGHNGDLCNNIYVENNYTEKYFTRRNISLCDLDKEYIIGRSIVIHERKDDCGLIVYEEEEKNINKYITGNAGKRIACGNIEKVN